MRLHRLRLLLLPLAWLYGLGFWLSRKFYVWGWRRSRGTSRFCVVALGNLSVGGTGKTPHTLYFAKRWSQEHLPLAVVTRGYGRSTRGVLEVKEESSAAEVGDEALLLRRNLPASIPVIVARQRAQALPLLERLYPHIRVILLDDAMQHWALPAHRSILLTAYGQPFFEDRLLPAGSLREPRSGAARAEVVVVSQCPNGMPPEERRLWLQRLRPAAGQTVCFSTYDYGKLYRADRPQNKMEHTDLAAWHVLLLAGIARPAALQTWLQTRAASLHSLCFGDHHRFRQADMERLCRLYARLPQPRIVVTTEKDLMRLEPWLPYLNQRNIAVWVLPVEVRFLE